MKNKYILSTLLLSTIAVISSAFVFMSSNLYEGFVVGNPDIESINSLSFGPDGILFIGDSKQATIYAIDTQDKNEKSSAEEVRIEALDSKIASSLGTTSENVEITDMAVNPISKTAYFSVATTDGTPVLLKLVNDKFENVSLKEVRYSKIQLEDPIAVDAKDRRDRPQRIWAISDLKYHDGKVLVSGLSNKEFASTFRSIPFPFKEEQTYASLEVWHAAHGQFETHAPIKTFDIVSIENVEYVMASYTCTPLVLFPLEELKEGTHHKGRTVAELGAGNSPIDMISYVKNGQKYILMSNNNRPVMRFEFSDIEAFNQTITESVDEFAATKGVPYDNLPFPYVFQMDLLDADNVLYVQRTGDGDLVLRSRSTQWM